MLLPADEEAKRTPLTANAVPRARVLAKDRGSMMVDLLTANCQADACTNYIELCLYAPAGSVVLTAYKVSSPAHESLLYWNKTYGLSK